MKKYLRLQVTLITRDKFEFTVPKEEYEAVEHALKTKSYYDFTPYDENYTTSKEPPISINGQAVAYFTWY